MTPPEQRILIVDDVPSNLTVLLDFLQEAGFKVFVAEDGESALQQLAFSRPDIVLLDVMMPGLDGFETCRRMKADPRYADTPVIFMTALSEQVDKLRGFEAGAVDYINKPLFPAEVMARVTCHLQRHTLERELRARNEVLDREIQRRVEAERRLRHSLDRAVLVIDDEGEILFSTLRAVELIRSYGGDASATRLPAPFHDLARSPAARLPHPTEPGRSLCARRFVEPDESDCTMLLLEETSAIGTDTSRLAGLGLTPRETEILFWVAQGKANAEIATILSTAPNTVKKHLQNMMPKLGVETRLAAALKAREHLGLALAGR